MSANEMSQGQKPSKLLDQMRDLMRVRRYALRTERAYRDWVVRYVKFHGMKSREDLADGPCKVEAFLTHLAVQGKVAPSTQNQALQPREITEYVKLLLRFFLAGTKRDQSSRGFDAASTRLAVAPDRGGEDEDQRMAAVTGTPL